MGLFPLGLKSVRRLFVYLLGVLNISMNLGSQTKGGFFFFFFFFKFWCKFDSFVGFWFVCGIFLGFWLIHCC
jgi:uncharacterized membrane protein YciS (DUF1049 family)